MNADRFFRDVQRVGNVAVVQPTRDAGEHLKLTGSELGSRNAFSQTVSGSARKIARSAVNGENRLHQDLATCIFRQISHSAVAHGAIDVLAAFIVRKNDDLGRRILLAEGSDDLKPIDARQSQIEHDDIGTELTAERNSLLAIHGLAGDDHVRSPLQNGTQCEASEKVVFDEQDLNRLCGHARPPTARAGIWKGTLTTISVPRPAAVSTWKVPPSLRARSSITGMPKC